MFIAFVCGFSDPPDEEKDWIGEVRAVEVCAAMNATLEDFLHRVPVMTGLDDEAIRFLSDLAREEHFAPRSLIISEGEPGNRMFFIAHGSATVVKGNESAHPLLLANYGPGDCFGEMSLIECVARSATVIAIDDVTAYTLRGVDFHRLYRHRPEQYGIVTLNLARELARRLRALDQRMFEEGMAKEGRIEAGD